MVFGAAADIVQGITGGHWRTVITGAGGGRLLEQPLNASRQRLPSPIANFLDICLQSPDFGHSCGQVGLDALLSLQQRSHLITVPIASIPQGLDAVAQLSGDLGLGCDQVSLQAQLPMLTPQNGQNAGQRCSDN